MIENPGISPPELEEFLHWTKVKRKEESHD